MSFWYSNTALFMPPKMRLDLPLYKTMKTNSMNELSGDNRNYFTSFLMRRGKPHVAHEPAAALLGRVAAEIDKMEDVNRCCDFVRSIAKSDVRATTKQDLEDWVISKQIEANELLHHVCLHENQDTIRRLQSRSVLSQDA